MNLFLILLAISVIVFLYIESLRNRLIRETSLYRLHDVKDQLLFLVSCNKLDKDGEIFTYYYARISRLLELAPNVGLDDIIDAFLSLSKVQDLSVSLSEANERADRMYSLVKEENNEVSEVIADYYAASKRLMLAHSSFWRLIYIVFFKIKLRGYVDRFQGARYRALVFARDEEMKFRHASSVS